jgi:GDP-L-fucose synthase
MNFFTNKKILVTGGAGFLGSKVTEELIRKGASPQNIRIPRSYDCDLREVENCKEVVQNIDIVIHLAAKVGGIGYNQEHPAELFYDNAIMGIQLMEAARHAGVSKSSQLEQSALIRIHPCSISRRNLWDGYPEETNAPYGLARRCFLSRLRHQAAIRFNAIYLLL